MNAALVGESVGRIPHRVAGPAANGIGGLKASDRTQRRAPAERTFRKARLWAVSPLLFVLWLCAGVGEARSADDAQVATADSEALWTRADDLGKAGLWPGNFPVRDFIRFGSHVEAERASQGKSKEDSQHALERLQQSHAASLTTRVFTWRCDGVGNEVVRAMAPLLCVVPDDAPITICDATMGPFWVLMKDGRLSKTRNYGDVQTIKRAGGFLYLQQSVESQLFIRLNERRQALSKEGLPKTDRLEVTLLLGKLRLAVPARVGFFSCDAMEASRGDTNAIRKAFDVGVNGPEGQPHYFVTAELDPIKDSGRGDPTADLLGIRVRLATGEATQPIWEWSAADQ